MNNSETLVRAKALVSPRLAAVPGSNQTTTINSSDSNSFTQTRNPKYIARFVLRVAPAPTLAAVLRAKDFEAARHLVCVPVENRVPAGDVSNLRVYEVNNA